MVAIMMAALMAETQALRQSEERRYGRYCVRPVGSSWCVTKIEEAQEQRGAKREERRGGNRERKRRLGLNCLIKCVT
jgi:hypothetical protein